MKRQPESQALTPGLQPMFFAEATIHPRTVKGRFANLRWLVVGATQAVFYGLPWINWGERPAIWFDLGARRFFLFDWVLYPHDFIFLATLLILCALGLFWVTAAAGRIWCGYACPQTVYTEIFMWIERVTCGTREQRLKLERSPWSLAKVRCIGSKHLLWLTVALWTGLTFVAYFIPFPKLLHELLHFTLSPSEAFWVLFYSAATYGNAGFMREQVCKYMCPYARFQSAMFDPHTWIVTYDSRRGEPRGSRRRGAEVKPGQGDCIDCTLCVQVCPTGIDIRKGLQYECIGCAACIDMCDQVMDKVGSPRGLIRYSTQAATQAPARADTSWLRQLARPRIVIYVSLWLVLAVAWVWALSTRPSIRLDVVRDRSVLARWVPGGAIENVYRLHAMNASSKDQRLRLSVEGLPGLKLVDAPILQLPAAQAVWVVVHVHVAESAATPLKPGSHAIRFTGEWLDKHGLPATLTEPTTFLRPR
jgi:cytochrome c oxidase accessory protein FixG